MDPWAELQKSREDENADAKDPQEVGKACDRSFEKVAHSDSVLDPYSTQSET